MPWTRDHFPARDAQPGTRDKAIEIANALLREGHDEGFAIRVAIAREHEWSQRHVAPPSGLGRF